MKKILNLLFIFVAIILCSCKKETPVSSFDLNVKYINDSGVNVYYYTDDTEFKFSKINCTKIEKISDIKIDGQYNYLIIDNTKNLSINNDDILFIKEQINSKNLGFSFFGTDRRVFIEGGLLDNDSSNTYGFAYQYEIHSMILLDGQMPSKDVKENNCSLFETNVVFNIVNLYLKYFAD